jgi:hypothetical protein
MTSFAKNVSKFAAIAAVIFLSVPAIYARPQASRQASLNGVVLGPTGKPVANAVVTYQSGGGDTPHVVHTDIHGKFKIAKLRGDNYDLRASAHGQYSSWQKNVMVRAGALNTLTLQLTDGADLTRASAKNR